MSLTIDTNGLKFVIFASGHDYTLADSGDGDVQIFSHPFVPLNSVNRAGQYYFLVPDEYGNPMDAVKDDIAHCTFTPALGTAFSTEGETTVEVNYHREYIYDEETIVVDKTVSQTIQVVNHGTVTQSETYYDYYSDGYGFYRPSSVNTVDNNMWLVGNGTPNKLSSLPWRSKKLGNGIYGFCNAIYLTDISELKYADTSQVIEMSRLFAGCQYLTVEKLKEAIGDWDVSSLQLITWAFTNASVTDLSFLEKWRTPNLVSLDGAFYAMQSLTSAHGLEHWDVSNVTSLKEIFDVDILLSDISALASWDVSKVQTMQGAFVSCYALADLTPLASWNVSSLTNIQSIFEGDRSITTLLPLRNWAPRLGTIIYAFRNCTGLTNLQGLENFDVSNVSNFQQVFDGDVGIRSLTGIENWNVSNGQNFSNCFADLHFITNILPLKDWDMRSATNISGMFASNGFLANLDGVVWNLASLSTNANAFIGHKLWYSSIIDKVVYEAFWFYYDIDGNSYMGTGIYDEDHPLVQIWKDASEAQNWTVGGSGLGMFDNVEWDNLPSWN